MNTVLLAKSTSIGEWLARVVNYQIIRGNEVWRFIFVLVAIFITMAVGRVVQYFISNYTIYREKGGGDTFATLFLKALGKPIYVAIFASGVYLCKIFLYFDDRAGIQISVSENWTETAKVIGAISVAYALYRLVDVIEYYLNRVVSTTQTKLDNMLVPVIRKSLRVTIAIIAALYIVENLLGAGRIKSLLVSAGIGGIAIALAAKDTIANFFGSVTIFADKPFQIDELVRIGEYLGTVEDVGFRSTRIRTFDGHLVTIPNNITANSVVENLGKRPYIRRKSDITITYNSGHTKAQRAVEIIKEILAAVPEINTDPQQSPRVYFSDFNDSSLNIYMCYWVKPADYWLYQQVNQRVNIEMMRRFEAEGIEFAFPSRTLYIKKE